MVKELPSLLDKNTLLVFNNSRVRKARIPAQYIPSDARHYSGGAKVDFLLVKQLNETCWEVMLPHSRRRRKGSRFVFEDGTTAEITNAIGSDTGSDTTSGDKIGETRILRFDKPICEEWLDKYGHIPLPPYIKRNDEVIDSERYQTIYAKTTGSAAAPTAGLHFTEELFAGLENAGIETAFITLHVGLGTFLPVRSENIEDHLMHKEYFNINDECASRIERAKAGGRRIIAVGTTSVRTLESSYVNGKIKRGDGNTSIFIYPGYSFKIVDGLFTNFHTPESTLIMLVSAFAGRDLILESYQEAVREGYMFFSYGDAMLII